MGVCLYNLNFQGTIRIKKNQQLMEPNARFHVFANMFSHFNFTLILTLTFMAPRLLWLLLFGQIKTQGWSHWLSFLLLSPSHLTNTNNTVTKPCWTLKFLPKPSF